MFSDFISSFSPPVTATYGVLYATYAHNMPIWMINSGEHRQLLTVSYPLVLCLEERNERHCGGVITKCYGVYFFHQRMIRRRSIGVSVIRDIWAGAQDEMKQTAGDMHGTPRIFFGVDLVNLAELGVLTHFAEITHRLQSAVENRRWLRDSAASRGRGSNLERRLAAGSNTGHLRNFLFGAEARMDNVSILAVLQFIWN